MAQERMIGSTNVERRDMIRSVVDAVTGIKYKDILDKSDGNFRGFSQKEFDSVEVSPELIFIADDGESFEASGIVYINPDSGDADFSMADSIPAAIKGKLKQDGAAIVTEIELDTSNLEE